MKGPLIEEYEAKTDPAPAGTRKGSWESEGVYGKRPVPGGRIRYLKVQCVDCGVRKWISMQCYNRGPRCGECREIDKGISQIDWAKRVLAHHGISVEED